MIHFKYKNKCFEKRILKQGCDYWFEIFDDRNLYHLSIRQTNINEQKILDLQYKIYLRKQKLKRILK